MDKADDNIVPIPPLMVRDGGYANSFKEMGLRQRAHDIEDLTGAQPQDLPSFRKKNYPIQYARAATLALGTALAVGLVCFFLGSSIIMGATVGALVVGGISLYIDQSRGDALYAQYLNKFAEKARAAQEKERSIAAPAPMGPAKQPQKQWAP